MQVRAIVVAALLMAASFAHAEPPKPFGTPRITRSSKLIVDFDLASVAPQAIAVGRGLFAGERAADDLGCSDSSSSEPKTPAGASYTDSAARVQVEVVRATPAGKSGRGWAGMRCTYRLTDIGDSAHAVELDDQIVPSFGFVSAIVREGDVIFVQLGWNGYAAEAKGKGNFVVAVDLAAGKILWRTPDMTSNGAVLVAGDYVVTGYGFTKEKAALHAFDRRTGALVQSLALPKAPSEIRRTADALVVRPYDGYAKVPFSAGK